MGQTSYTVTSAGVQNARASSPIGVRDGDVLGMHFHRQSIIPFSNYVCAHEQSYAVYVLNQYSRYFPMDTQKFTKGMHGGMPCRNYSLNAVISGTGRYYFAYINLLKGGVRKRISCCFFVFKAGVSI